MKVLVPRKVLVIDVGGTHVKLLLSGEDTPRKFESGPSMTASEMVKGVRQLTKDWKYDAIAMGYPGPGASQSARSWTPTTSARAG